MDVLKEESEMNLTTIPQELLGPWMNLDFSKLRYPLDFKYRDRNKILEVQWANCKDLAPDYLKQQNKSVIDISAANGAALEIFRYFGYDIMAVDYYREPNGYELFLKSQNIPYINHDCSIIPYPIKDKSYDLLLNFSAITQYSNDLTIWPKVMDEFAKITKSTICMIVNYGWKLDKGRQYLIDWKHPDFKLTLSSQNRFRWDLK